MLFLVEKMKTVYTFGYRKIYLSIILELKYNMTKRFYDTNGDFSLNMTFWNKRINHHLFNMQMLPLEGIHEPLIHIEIWFGFDYRQILNHVMMMMMRSIHIVLKRPWDVASLISHQEISQLLLFYLLYVWSSVKAEGQVNGLHYNSIISLEYSLSMWTIVWIYFYFQSLSVQNLLSREKMTV